MKNLLTLIFIFTLSVSIGQKKEIKKAIKAFDAGDVQGATDILETNAALFDTADDKVTLQKTYLEAKIDRVNKEFQSSLDKFKAYEAAGGNDPEYANEVISLTSAVVNSAIEDNAEQRYAEAASKLYLAYTIDPETNKDYLYFAASSAVNGQDFDNALKYYNLLKEIKYDGVVTQYFAKPAKSDEEVELSESEYSIYKKTNEYTNFREETTESRYPEIIKNIALIYAQIGDNEKAMGAVKLARMEDPKDLNLILTEANLYIQLEETERFGELMKEAIAQDPNNATLYFNLGVVNAQNGNTEEAREYYEKTIELDPNYESGYLNLVSLILQGESEILEEMNGLGTSRADNVRYDELKLKREELYRECVPVLEKLVELNKNQEAIKTLMNIHGTLGNNEGFKRMKEMVE